MSIIKSYLDFKNSISEASNADELRDKLSDLGYTEKSKELSSGGDITDDIQRIAEVVLSEFKKIAPEVKVTVTGGNDAFHHNLSYVSRHTKGQAVDLVVTPNTPETRSKMISVLDRVSDGTPGFSYIDEYTNPTKAATAGHFHISYGSNPENSRTANAKTDDPIEVTGLTGAVAAAGSASSDSGIIIDADLITRLISKLKEKNFSEKDLAKFAEIKKTDSSKSIELDVKDFDGIVAKVIDKLEGGYYHPDMLQDGRVRDARYGNSGETMMGIDRKAGGDINTTPEGIEFWKLIDDANARTEWKWGYRGGALESQLRKLAGKMIKRYYDKYASRYLSGKALTIVNENPKLLFNFVYAVWNGPGWFKNFADDINSAVDKGITDPEELAKIQIKDRLDSGNSLVAQGGKKIADLLDVKVA
jgi:hypothetical protein